MAICFNACIVGNIIYGLIWIEDKLLMDMDDTMSSNEVKKKFYEDMQSFYEKQDKYNFLYAISKGEVKEYLRGDGEYRKYSASDFYIAYEPTETGRVIKDVFFTEVTKAGAVDMFFDYLGQMAGESALGAYLTFDYVGALKYEDKEHTINIEPYKNRVKDLEETVTNSLLKYREELQDEIRFPNGWNTVNPWDEIARRWNDVLDTSKGLRRVTGDAG